jgi:dipeptidyl aminopeptidase/acylaminoacyl peptidase
VLVEMAAGLREKRQRLAIGTLGVIDEKPTLEGRVERLVDLAGKAVPMTRMNRMAVAAAGAFGAVALAIVVATTIHAADELTAAERKASAAVGADSPSGSDQRTKKPEMLMQLSQDGTVVRKLCDVPTHPTIGSPALSPAGDLIACDGNRPGTSYQGTELLMINADGTNVECLGNGAMPSWSADGTRLAFSCFAPRGVWVLNLATKKRELIDNEGWGIQWSPDGKYWAYSRRGALVVKNVATGEVHEQVADFRDDQVVWGQNMAWSPDGRSLCGVVHLRNNQSAVVVEMLELPRAEAPLAAANPQDVDQFDGGGMRLFYVGQDINRDVAWHPSGHRIVFTTFSAPTGRFQMFEFDPTKDSMPSLVAGQTATNNFDQCWSADGKTLLYVAEPNVDGDAEQ